MVKPEWGTKRTCPNCGARYYDMHHDPIICPKCGTAFDAEAVLKTRRVRVAAPVEVPRGTVTAGLCMIVRTSTSATLP